MADGNELTAIARVKFHEGELEKFKRVSSEVIETVRAKDTGTLKYEIYLNDDQTECIFLEQYRDVEAMIQHNDNLGDLLGEMLGTGSVSAELFIQPSDELRAKFAGLPISFFTPFRSLPASA